MLRRAGGSESEKRRLKREKDALMKDLRIFFNEEEILRKWLDAPNDRLGGKKPNELLGTPEQRHLVDMVEAVKYGLPT
jgi:uncharacterized protein (DUF2384 family)